MKHKKIFIPLIALGGVVVVLFGGIGVANLVKFGLYKDYYAIEKTICKIPGLKDGFVPQGLTVHEPTNSIITSGYMTKGASRIYVIDEHYNARAITLSDNGKPFYGHCGGVAVANDVLYLANGDGANSGVYHMDLSMVLDPSTTTIDLDKEHKFAPIEGSASFVFSDDTYLYVGEFHNKNYVCNHNYQSKNEGMHHALATRFAADDVTLSNPLGYISIRDEVQGFAVNPNNSEIVLSTSYGLASSNYYVYHADALYESGETLNGRIVYMLEDAYRVVKAPPMSEGIDFNTNDGYIYQINELASNKYVIGKFFNAGMLNAIKLW